MDCPASNRAKLGALSQATDRGTGSARLTLLEKVAAEVKARDRLAPPTRLVGFRSGNELKSLDDGSAEYRWMDRVSLHLNEGGYAIVDGVRLDSLSQVLKDGWGLQLEKVVEFSTFLKKNEIFVVRKLETDSD